MPTTDELLDRLAIAELVHRYAWASDGRDFAAMRELFCDDAAMEIELAATGARNHIEGAAAIAEFVEQRHRGEFAGGHRRRHTTDCFVLDACDGQRAQARAYFCVIAAVDGQAPKPVSMGCYHDSLRKIDGRWRFAHRRIVIEGRASD